MVSTQNTIQKWAPRLFAGALAGLVASIPMALVMMGLNKILPRQKQSLWDRFRALPPKQITARVARRSGLGQAVAPGQKWEGLTWLAHLGYGAATSTLYPLVTRPLPLPRNRPAANMVRGMLFALTIWAGSYLGWLPAVNIMPPATKQPARRNIILIASHLVWGSLIGLLTGWLGKRLAGQAE